MTDQPMTEDEITDAIKKANSEVETIYWTILPYLMTAGDRVLALLYADLMGRWMASIPEAERAERFSDWTKLALKMGDLYARNLSAGKGSVN